MLDVAQGLDGMLALQRHYIFNILPILGVLGLRVLEVSRFALVRFARGCSRIQLLHELCLELLQFVPVQRGEFHVLVESGGFARRKRVGVDIDYGFLPHVGPADRGEVEGVPDVEHDLPEGRHSGLTCAEDREAPDFPEVGGVLGD